MCRFGKILSYRHAFAVFLLVAELESATLCRPFPGQNGTMPIPLQDKRCEESISQATVV